MGTPDQKKGISSHKKTTGEQPVKEGKTSYPDPNQNHSLQAFVLNDITAPPYELSPFQKIAKIKAGISKSELTSIKEAVNLDYDTLAQLLSVARATLIHKKGHEKFNTNVSEKILALADMYSYGYEVFDDIERFNDWMKTPNMALGRQRPIELADTITGIEEIKHLIGRIDYGVYS